MSSSCHSIVDQKDGFPLLSHPKQNIGGFYVIVHYSTLHQCSDLSKQLPTYLEYGGERQLSAENKEILKGNS